MGSRFQVHEDYVARAESLLPLAHEDSYICAMRDKILSLRERRARRSAAREESEAEMSAAEAEAPEAVRASVEVEPTRPGVAPTTPPDGGGAEHGESGAADGAAAVNGRAVAACADEGELPDAAPRAAVASAPIVLEPTVSPIDTTVVAADDSTDHADIVSMDTGPEDADSAESFAPGDGAGTSAASGGSDASGEPIADKGDADDESRAAGDPSASVEPDSMSGMAVEPPAAHDEVDADTEPEDMSDESDGESIITMLTEEDTMCSSGESARELPPRARARARHLSLALVDAARGAPSGSWDAALAASGAVLQAVDAVLEGEAANALCAVRPPGHHAGARHGALGACGNGFCIVNGVALGALYAAKVRGVPKVAVVDFDVHHGNGTQDILARTYDPAFLFVSVHAAGDDCFPGTGAEAGAVPHAGVLNLPVGQRMTPKNLFAVLPHIIARLEVRCSPRAAARARLSAYAPARFDRRPSRRSGS